jgi:hypothetical protein
VQPDKERETLQQLTPFNQTLTSRARQQYARLRTTKAMNFRSDSLAACPAVPDQPSLPTAEADLRVTR